ncbi:hypothetical protein [Streptomyces sp. NPDC002490]|uniref:hypothetical protein n=1 Tax=Streptomyces sp. NPDC002490 TaxID=3154416 RepID=UPI003332BFC1
MKRTTTTVAACLALLLTGCLPERNNSSAPLEPLPANVPDEPRYQTADQVREAMEKGGVDCRFLRRGLEESTTRSALECAFENQGTTVQAQITVFDRNFITEGEMGRLLASGRTAPFSKVTVAAGNWYIRLLPSDTMSHARKVAKALNAVALPKLIPLPDIPDTPRRTTLETVADQLNEIAPCTERKERDGFLLCTSAPKDLQCLKANKGSNVILWIYRNGTERDEHLRALLTDESTNRKLVTAGNWAASFCDLETAEALSEKQQARLILHRPGGRPYHPSHTPEEATSPAP